MIGATVALVPHAVDRMRQAQLSRIEILSALGPNVLHPDGSLAVPLARPGSRPAPGGPIAIGRTHLIGKPTRTVLLATTRQGRRLHIVVVPEPPRLVVVTLWDADDPAVTPLWRPDALAPTPRGERTLPPTQWLLGATTDRYRPLLRPLAPAAGATPSELTR